jgi:hypothetical protein
MKFVITQFSPTSYHLMGADLQDQIVKERGFLPNGLFSSVYSLHIKMYSIYMLKYQFHLQLSHLFPFYRNLC